MKYWLVFVSDDSHREGCSVFYSWLVKAASKREAIEKYCTKRGGFGTDPDTYDAEEMEVIE